MKEILLVGFAGFVGANARYLLGAWITARLGSRFPYGTFVINMSGSFILGVIMGAFEAQPFYSAVRLSLSIGFVGAYTTYSTFTYETVRLLEGGNLLLATANVLGSVLIGLLAVALGLAVGRAF